MNYTFLRDDQETELSVEYTYTSLGASPTWDDPGWDPEFEVQKVYNAQNQEVSSMLTREEWNRLDQEIFQDGLENYPIGSDPDDFYHARRDAQLDREPFP